MLEVPSIRVSVLLQPHVYSCGQIAYLGSFHRSCFPHLTEDAGIYGPGQAFGDDGKDTWYLSATFDEPEAAQT
jgi:hypothetical protein